MSELMNARANGQDFRKRLLTTVSALALTASLYGVQSASASDDDSDRPVAWIELGGQLERMDGGQVSFAPSFFDTITKNGFESPLEVSKPSIYSYGAEAEISFIPEGADWVFSGSVRYGRSDGHKALHQQTTQVTHYTIISLHRTKAADPNFEDAKANNSSTHVIADFQAGKDVGLGMFGDESMSTVSIGVRFAQFSEKSNFTIHAKPDIRFVNVTFYGFKIPFEGTYHNYGSSGNRVGGFWGRSGGIACGY